MRYTFLLGLLAAAGLAAPARAEVLVSTPWVTVHVGRPLPPPELVPNFVPGDPPPVPVPEPLGPPSPGAAGIVGAPIPVVSAAVRPPTLEEFAESFHAAPGHYEVVVLHPVTCCPVKLCFTLPCACPKVKVHAKSLVFSYGLFDKVAIHFHHDGSVTVKD